MEFIEDFSRTWADPQMRHAMLVHWPIVLSALAALFTLVLAINCGKSAMLRTIALLICAAVAGSGFLTKQSGQFAEDAAPALAPSVDRLLHEHEELGEKVPIFGLICCAASAAAFVPRKAVRISAAWLAFMLCGGTALWTANAAHHGGLLLYEYGVGAPQPAAVQSSAPQPAQVSPASSDDAVFRAQILPILVDHCTKCHNPQRVAQGKSAGLDQTTYATLMKGSRSGPVIVPGKPEQSILIQRVHGKPTPDDIMPPRGNDPLTPEQIATLVQWISQSALGTD